MKYSSGINVYTVIISKRLLSDYTDSVYDGQLED